MAAYLLDTNILLRAADDQSAEHTIASRAVSTLIGAGHECYLTAQILIEFWAVSTRPVSANGLGWSVAKTQLEILNLLDQFPLLEETPAIFRRWLGVVAQYSIAGRRVYDSRLLAVAQTHGITHILTFNGPDFPASNVALADPHDVAKK